MMTIVVLRVQRRLNWFYRNLMPEEFEFMKYFIGSSCRIARDVENIVKNNKHQTPKESPDICNLQTGSKIV